MSDKEGRNKLTQTYKITCINACETELESDDELTKEELIVIIVSLAGACLLLIIIFSCALNYLRKKYKNKLNAVEAYTATEMKEEYDEYKVQNMQNDMGNGEFLPKFQDLT